MSEHEPQQEAPTPGLAAPEDELLTGHNYDGIQEYDNPTPAWWTWVFIATLIFGHVYLLLSFVTAGVFSPQAEYERAAVANLKKKFGEIGVLEADAPTIVQYMDEPEWLKLGENVFKANCVTCHGLDGEGNSGPNLTDNAYLHVNSIEDIATVVKDGAKAGAMPAWGNRMHPNEIVLVSSYVASLRGTNASGGKPAEGDVPPPWPTEADAVEPEPESDPETAE